MAKKKILGRTEDVKTLVVKATSVIERVSHRSYSIHVSLLHYCPISVKSLLLHSTPGSGDEKVYISVIHLVNVPSPYMPLYSWMATTVAVVEDLIKKSLRLLGEVSARSSRVRGLHLRLTLLPKCSKKSPTCTQMYVSSLPPSILWNYSMLLSVRPDERIKINVVHTTS